MQNGFPEKGTNICDFKVKDISISWRSLIEIGEAYRKLRAKIEMIGEAGKKKGAK